MRIGIDASITKLNQAGSGVYASSLIDALRRVDSSNTYHLFAGRHKRQMGQRKTFRSRIETIYHDIAWTHLVLPYQAWQTGIDVLHVPSSVMPLFSPCPTVISILDTTALAMPQHFNVWQRHYSRLLMPLSARRASMIVTISEQSKRDIVERLNVQPGKVAVTYLAASPAFQPVSGQAIAEVKQRYGLKSFILTVGTLEPRKNLSRLLQAYAWLNCSHQLVHVGPKGWQYDNILAQLDRLGLRERVRLLGYVPLDDLVGLYNAASLFVYPSLYEGFGLPILEAMACGCPVVTSNVSAMPEVAGEAAMLIDPYDVQAIAGAIQRVLGDPALADRMREQGFAQARRFSWERCAQETIGVYRRALEA
jgi:glycosyltransferase involved in cell wall biosynthesis